MWSSVTLSMNLWICQRINPPLVRHLRIMQQTVGTGDQILIFENAYVQIHSVKYTMCWPRALEFKKTYINRNDKLILLITPKAPDDDATEFHSLGSLLHLRCLYSMVHSCFNAILCFPFFCSYKDKTSRLSPPLIPYLCTHRTVYF